MQAEAVRQPSAAALRAFPEWRCLQDGEPFSESGERLICAHGHAVPIVKGIPRFVQTTRYVDAFGEQWRRYRRTQLDSYTGTTISRDRLRRALGERAWTRLEGMQVVECGCGAGRFTEVLLDRGAHVTSIDLSDAVDANADNCPEGPAHRIAQADALALPFAPRQFDLVLCLGVVQHTPDPEATIAALYDHVRPGGVLVIDHYTPELSWYTKTAPIVRRMFRHLPPARGIQVTEALTRALWPLHVAAARSRITNALLTRVSPIACYIRGLPQLSPGLQKEWALLDTHDALTCYYRHMRTRSRMTRYLASLGGRDIWCEHGGNGIEARVWRPEA